MGRYSISEVWNENPDYEAMAHAMLDLLLGAEAEGRLDELLSLLSTSSIESLPPLTESDGSSEAA